MAFCVRLLRSAVGVVSAYAGVHHDGLDNNAVIKRGADKVIANWPCEPQLPSGGPVVNLVVGEVYGEDEG